MDRKLKLAVEDLSVESFHVVRGPTQRGTVVAHATGEWDVSCGGSCADTCDPCDWQTRGGFSCYGTCDYTCDNCDGPTEAWSCDHTCGPCGDYTPTRDSQVTG